MQAVERTAQAAQIYDFIVTEFMGKATSTPAADGSDCIESRQRHVGRNSKAYCAACSPSRSIAQAWTAAQAAARLYLRSTGSWRRSTVMLSIRMDHAPFKPAENIRRITACGLMPPYAGYAGDAIA